MDRKLWIVFLIVSFCIGFAFPTYVLARHEKFISPFFSSRILDTGQVHQTIVPSPSIIPTVLPTPSLSPTPIPSPYETPTPPTPIKQKTTPIQDTKKIFILSEINAYRRQNGLPEVASNTETCLFAKLRSQEIVQNFNHDGFRERINSRSLPYDSYSQVTENIAMNSDYTQVVSGWISSPPHAENMRADTPFVCVVYTGNYYVYEGWRP